MLLSYLSDEQALLDHPTSVLSGCHSPLVMCSAEQIFITPFMRGGKVVTNDRIHTVYWGHLYINLYKNIFIVTLSIKLKSN